jgi:uncharacterized protein
VVKDVLECGELLVSDATLAEIAEVLRRPKFDRYVSRGLREQFLTTLPEFATHVVSSSGSKHAGILRMTSSSRRLSTAQADFLVTGDGALLSMQTFRSVGIVSPSGYLRIARGQS